MKLLASLLAFPLLFAFVQGQPGQAPDPKVELKLDAKQAAPGGMIKGKVVVTFAPGWHGYQNPPKNDFEIPLKVESATKDLKVKATYPKGTQKPFMGEATMMYEGTVTIPIVLTLPKKKGEYPFKLEVSYQQCDDSSCLPPDKVVVSEKVSLKAAKP